ncbi:hypothetical protein NDU88_006410 [Pleurodeles waltl]|uniref:Uncharacterized protein n=1 Tax=Pleurodeles waltl TaxID=8319 RepID=A0AAV7WCG3_PLEWA|nr:hypothetical protein NDU88_006410 [Pleurodeles waltl]
MRGDAAWNDGFWVKEEGLGRRGEESRADSQRERQGGKEQEDAIEQATGCKKGKEEKGRENIRGKQLGSKEDPQGDTDPARSNEEEEKEEESRGTGGGNLLHGVGGDWESARKEDTAKGPCHVPGGAWLHKVWRFCSTNVPIGAKGHKREIRESWEG